MPIAIDCPVCETPVRLFANGFVEPHGEREPCIFTRTARSEADNRPLIAEDREAEADANPPWLKCDVCQKILRSSPDGRSDAHLDRQLEWCEGGADPTLEQAERVARKRSPEAPPGAGQEPLLNNLRRQCRPRRHPTTPMKSETVPS